MSNNERLDFKIWLLGNTGISLPSGDLAKLKVAVRDLEKRAYQRGFGDAEDQANANT